jgi:hypothetical protein
LRFSNIQCSIILTTSVSNLCPLIYLLCLVPLSYNVASQVYVIPN